MTQSTPKPASKGRAGYLLKAAFEALEEGYVVCGRTDCGKERS